MYTYLYIKEWRNGFKGWEEPEASGFAAHAGRWVALPAWWGHVGELGGGVSGLWRGAGAVVRIWNGRGGVVCWASRW